MSKKDYYAVLGLTGNCTLQEIRTNFRKLALKWHPDKCQNKPESEAKFNEIHEAYSILNDPTKKKIYDEFGHEGLKLTGEYEGSLNQNKASFFYQKGFQGTDKSAFDILKEIFQDNDNDEDDDFFQNYDDFGISETLKSTMKTFIEDHVFCNENDGESNFFESYKPSFMNPNFFMPPPEFPDLGFENFTAHVFSFSPENTYSRNSTTIIQDGKTVTSPTTEMFQNNEKGFFDRFDTNQDTKRPSTDFMDKNFYDSVFNSKAKDKSFTVIDDDSTNDSAYSNYKNNGLFTFDEFDKGCDFEADTNTKLNLTSKKIRKTKEGLNIKLINKKPSKKNRS